jgi:hypothetical protein
LLIADDVPSAPGVTAEVLADVEEKDVDRRRVASARPFLRGSVENNAYLPATQGLLLHQLPECVVRSLDHRAVPVVPGARMRSAAHPRVFSCSFTVTTGRAVQALRRLGDNADYVFFFLDAPTPS